MAGANVNPVSQNTYRCDKDKFKAMMASPVISAAISVTTAGTTNAVEVPPGAIVYDVGLWNLGTAIAGATISVGTVGSIGKFLANVSSIDSNGIKRSGLAGTVAANPIGGQYFSSGGVIQVGVAAGGTDESRVKVLVWYTLT